MKCISTAFTTAGLLSASKLRAVDKNGFLKKDQKVQQLSPASLHPDSPIRYVVYYLSSTVKKHLHGHDKEIKNDTVHSHILNHICKLIALEMRAVQRHSDTLL